MPVKACARDRLGGRDGPRAVGPRSGFLPPAGALSGTVELDGCSGRVALIGELDLWTGEQLDVALTTLIRGGFTTVVVDLQGVRFLDCAGLRPLVRAARSAAAAGGGLRVERPRPPVRQVLRLTGTDALLGSRRVRPR